MPKERAGYHNLTTQLTEAAWQKLSADAAERNQSVAQVLNEILHAHYRISLRKIPPRKRPGRKPKK